MTTDGTPIGEYIPTNALRDRLVNVERQLARLQIEREMLSDLLKTSISVKGPWGQKPQVLEATSEEAPTGSTDDHLPSPSDAAYDLVKSEPGIKHGELSRRLDGKVKSSAGNQKRSIYNTVYNMIKGGKFQKVGDRLYLPEDVPNHHFTTGDKDAQEKSQGDADAESSSEINQ